MTHWHPGLGFGFGLGPRRWATRGERRLNRVGGPGRPERQTRPVVWNRQQFVPAAGGVLDKTHPRKYGVTD